MIKKVLKIKIHQPDAHYRVHFSYQRRFTYPIPSFSTVKGLICNLMGIKNDSDKRFKQLKKGLSLAIYGKYESLIKEYTWFRNLGKESHIDRFKVVENRYIDNILQHPGGQMPVIADVLHNVNLIIYVFHPETEFLDNIKNAFEEPSQRLTTIHLGRAEDWVIIQKISYVEIKQKQNLNIPYFTWLPDRDSVNCDFICDDYDDFFKTVSGNILKLPTFYSIKNNQRVFNEYVTVIWGREMRK